jgi:Cof subfamily protein (haloacid dehalogenase superfamily)
MGQGKTGPRARFDILLSLDLHFGPLSPAHLSEVLLLTYRLLVADVDGTLIGADLTPSPRVRAAIRAATDRGLRIALCTGRTPLSCPNLIDLLELHGPQIYLDGALIADPAGGPEVYVSGLDQAASETLLTLCRDEDLALELYGTDRYYVERRTDLIRLHEDVQGLTAEVTDLGQVIAAGRVVKGEIVAAGEAGRTAVRRVESALAGRIRFSWAKVAGYPDVEFVNLVAPDVSKGTALRRLAAWHEVPLPAVAAIGDGRNDLPMIQTAGLGIAMGNAAEEVRRAAGFVTASVEEDGLADAIDRLLEGIPALP